MTDKGSHNCANTQIENLDGEVWKDVVGYEGLYQVSNMGRVKSVKRVVNSTNPKQSWKTINERILKPSSYGKPPKCGGIRHLDVVLYRKGKQKQKKSIALSLWHLSRIRIIIQSLTTKTRIRATTAQITWSGVHTNIIQIMEQEKSVGLKVSPQRPYYNTPYKGGLSLNSNQLQMPQLL